MRSKLVSTRGFVLSSVVLTLVSVALAAERRTASAMADAATRFLAALTPDQRMKACLLYTSPSPRD